MSEELKPKKPNWERELLEKLAFAWVKEQRRNRFWRVFFRTLAFVYLFMLLFYMLVLQMDIIHGIWQNIYFQNLHFICMINHNFIKFFIIKKFHIFSI